MNSDVEEKEASLFMRYLKTTGDITAERLRFLWLSDYKPVKYNIGSTMKLRKTSTQVTFPASPKSVLTQSTLERTLASPKPPKTPTRA